MKSHPPLWRQLRLRFVQQWQLETRAVDIEVAKYRRKVREKLLFKPWCTAGRAVHGGTCTAGRAAPSTAVVHGGTCSRGARRDLRLWCTAGLSPWCTAGLEPWCTA